MIKFKDILKESDDKYLPWDYVTAVQSNSWDKFEKEYKVKLKNKKLYNDKNKKIGYIKDDGLYGEEVIYILNNFKSNNKTFSYFKPDHNLMPYTQTKNKKYNINSDY